MSGRRLDIRDLSGKRQYGMHREEVAPEEEAVVPPVEAVVAPPVVVERRKLSLREQFADSSEDEAAGLSREKEEASSVSAGVGITAITTFNDEWDFLHPDYPCNVSPPMTVTDLGQVMPFKYFPSLSMAVASLFWSIDSDVAGERDTPYNPQEASNWCRAKQNEAKELLKASPFAMSSLKEERRMCKILEGLSRDKFQRNRELGVRLISTSDRALVFSDATQPIFGEMIESLLEPNEKFGRKYLTGDNLIGRICMKIRDDQRQGFRGLVRWMAHYMPVERELKRRNKVKVIEARGGGDNRLETISTHDLDRKVDIRDYFETGTAVDRSQIFVTFPANEKEDIADASAAFRRRKRQRILDDITARDDEIDQGDERGQALPSLFIGIGKMPENEISCLNPSVSRNHCAIIPLEKGKIVAVDFGSKGGTFVNENQIAPFTPLTLSPDDTIRVGQSARLFTVKFRAINTAQLLAMKKQELERKLASLNASLTTSKSDAKNEAERTIVLSGFPDEATVEDLEDVLAAHRLGNAKIAISSGKGNAPFLNRGRSESRGGGPASYRTPRPGRNTATLVFSNRMEAWKAKDKLNGRSVKGLKVMAAWAT